MVVQRSPLLRPLLLVAVLLLITGVLPAAARGAPAMAAIPTESALLFTEAERAVARVNIQPDRVSSTTIEVQIAAGSDDAGIDYECRYSTAKNEIYLGLCQDGQEITSGLRFVNVPIPSSAKILDAHIRFTVDGLFTDDIRVDFYGEASGNANTFSDTDRPEDRSLVADQTTQWHIQASDPWELGEFRDSPPLTAIVQAIVDRSDWSQGNALAFIIKNGGPASGTWRARRVIGYERPSWYPGTEYAAILVATYMESNTKTVTALRAGSRPTVDGDLSEWQGLSQTLLNKDTAATVTGDLPTYADLSAGLRAAWRSSVLYFAVAVTDDVLVGNHNSKPWYDDAVELSLFVPPNNKTHHFVIGLDGRQTDNDNAITSLLVTTRTVPGGWTLETVIPAWALGLTGFTAGEQYPFTFGLWDDDTRDWPAQTHLLWQGTTGEARQPEWGTLEPRQRHLRLSGGHAHPNADRDRYPHADTDAHGDTHEDSATDPYQHHPNLYGCNLGRAVHRQQRRRAASRAAAREHLRHPRSVAHLGTGRQSLLGHQTDPFV